MSEHAKCGTHLVYGEIYEPVLVDGRVVAYVKRTARYCPHCSRESQKVAKAWLADNAPAKASAKSYKQSPISRKETPAYAGT